MKLLVPLKGSVQNPTFGPDGKSFLITLFRGGYGQGTADLYIADIRDRERITLVTKDLEGKRNISAPGFQSTWNNGLIIFASDVDGAMWPHTIAPNGSGRRKMPGYLDGYMGLNPTMSPDSARFAFELHNAGVETGGKIVVKPVDDSAGARIVSEGEAQAPSWSPDGRMLAWQAKDPNGDWRIAIHDIETGDTKLMTPAGRSFTRPTWRPDSQAVICGGEMAVYEVSTTGSVQVAYSVEHPRTAYVGAPSWSPETISRQAGTRRRLLCEACERDNPIDSRGTWLEVY
jgi:Tol biopolymer transport system component